MDTIGLIIIVATAERKIVAFQCNEATGTAAQVASMDSPLKYQSRSIAALPEGDGFALGGTEGRVAVHFFHDPPDPKDGRVKKFAFRCHRRANADHPDVPRNETHLFPVNAIKFNSQGTFATGGGDGSISFWCKASRTRLKIGYDWHKGYQNATNEAHVFIHPVNPEDIKKRPPKT
ncbi:hypothetical protein CBS9595_002161 [Malassezia furfur]|nr:hypothetical protein CBS9595_002161 [Malassezia furfur]